MFIFQGSTNFLTPDQQQTLPGQMQYQIKDIRAQASAERHCIFGTLMP